MLLFQSLAFSLAWKTKNVLYTAAVNHKTLKSQCYSIPDVFKIPYRTPKQNSNQKLDFSHFLYEQKASLGQFSIKGFSRYFKAVGESIFKGFLKKV